MQDDVVLEVRSLSKGFPGVQALDSVNFTLHAGSVHAVCGENGAGKSTLMNILMGVYRPDAGEILVKGKRVHFLLPRHALEAGISIIEQELNPVSEMTVAENLFLGREVTKLGLWINYRELERRAEELLQPLEMHIDVRCKMKHLSLSEIQMVEIAKAVSYDSDIIIMDEPTSAIGERDADHLFRIIELLKSHGKGIIYVSHRMNEIFRISDMVTVLRDGKYIGTKPTVDLDRHELISMMIGRKLEEEFIKTNVPTEEVILEVKDLTKTDRFWGVNLKLRKGEILGIFGLMGSGRSEFLNSLFGVDRPDAGEILIDGKRRCHSRPKNAIRNGIAYVTEDRKDSGLVLTSSVKHNISLSFIRQLSGHIFIRTSREDRMVKEMVDRFRIRTPSISQLVSNLSGGNQQKVVLSKWLLTEPKILLLDEPTRGIDVGAKREIYKFMSDFASKGFSIIMISSEISEVLRMSDRIIILKDGKLVAELPQNAATQDLLMHYAS